MIFVALQLEHGILRRAQRRRRTHRVVFIPLRHIAQHFLKAYVLPLFLQLGKAAASPRLGAGRQKYLQGRVRQNDRPYVASIHDNAGPTGHIALHVHQKRAHGGYGRNAGRIPGYRRRPYLRADVLAVEMHMLKPVLPVAERDIQRREQRRDRRRILRIDARAGRRQPDRPIDRAGVHIDKAEALRNRLGDGALSGAGGSVDGDGKPFITHSILLLYFCRHSGRSTMRSED